MLDEKRLWLFEKRIGTRLPEDYRQFLINHNGGKPIPCYFRISEAEGENSLHHFYGLHDGPSYLSLEEAYENHKGMVPTSMISFADDPFGNALCIGIEADNKGKIFFWDHEAEDNITEVSKTFSLFLESLFEWVDPDEIAIEKIIRTGDLAALTELINSGFDIEFIDEHGRTMLEAAAIAANDDMVRLLLERGAEVRNALDYAEKNARFFDKHKSTVSLIKEFLKKAAPN